MEPTPKQQAISLINTAHRILVVPGRPDGDSVGSALALLLILAKAGKQVVAVTMDEVPDTYRFLPARDQLTNELVGVRDFIISLNGNNTEPDKLSYNIEGGRLNIIITPKTGSYSAENVTFTEGAFKYDLIITLDAPVLSELGKIYTTQPEIFNQVPVLNIDHHASNAHFGSVNLVDIAATSTGEILVSLAEALNVEFDADIATCLLTGIVSDTGSFQHANTTPKSLTVAAQMVGFGARQQEIIKYLFKTKPLAALRLWGKILSKLQFDPSLKLVWAGSDLATIQEVGATAQDITGLIDELMTSVPGAEIIILLTEREPGTVFGSIRTSAGVDASAIAGMLGGGGHTGAAGFKLFDTTYEAAVAKVVDTVSRYRSPSSATPEIAVQA
jgi:phosphoesterase RecJ-like protein